MWNTQHRFIITIDGAAGTGKSSVAQELALRLDADCLDTGAMYRAVALLSLENGIDPLNGEVLANTIREVGIRFDWSKTPSAILIGDEDVSDRIRDLDISGIVSIVAKQPEVREVLVEQQRNIGENHPLLVSEGRDQGSVVFPDAAIRFFLQAEVNERTKRRVNQLRQTGATVNDEEVQRDIEARDKIDSSRADGPLICPEGAIIIDTSTMTINDVVDAMQAQVTALMSR